jgi:hypothetical protein
VTTPQRGIEFMSAMRKKKSAKTQKGDQTKALILETALEMFQKRGYEQTTMRAIAEKSQSLAWQCLLLLSFEGTSHPGLLPSHS